MSLAALSPSVLSRALPLGFCFGDSVMNNTDFVTGFAVPTFSVFWFADIPFSMTMPPAGSELRHALGLGDFRTSFDASFAPARSNQRQLWGHR